MGHEFYLPSSYSHKDVVGDTFISESEFSHFNFDIVVVATGTTVDAGGGVQEDLKFLGKIKSDIFLKP